MKACPGLPVARRPGHVIPAALVQRMRELAKFDAKESKRLATLGKVFGVRIDDPGYMAKVLDGDWMILLSKVLDAVVSPQTKQRHLNCVTCDTADFPVLLSVILIMAYGSPSEMWPPRGELRKNFVGYPGSERDIWGDRDGPPASHKLIAEQIWYRPQLAMLLTSIWPRTMRIEYFGSALNHTINPEGEYPRWRRAELSGAIGPRPHVGELP